MILRRIAKSLCSREYSTPGLGLLVPIARAFAGIQVSKRNDDWIDDLRGQQYLEWIGTDLEEPISNTADRLRFWTKVYDLGAQALRYTKTGALADTAFTEATL